MRDANTRLFAEQRHASAWDNPMHSQRDVMTLLGLLSAFPFASALAQISSCA